VIAQGGIRREAVLNLVALRALTGPDAIMSRKLQRYVLGLALVALLARSEKFLRQGCLLVPRNGMPADANVVDRTGVRNPLAVTEESALAFALEAATDFGVGEPWAATFDKDAVKKASEKKKDDKAKKAK
jgi:CRISPR-associated protein Csb1